MEHAIERLSDSSPSDSVISPYEYILRQQVCRRRHGCVLPDAPNVDQFWQNIVAGRVSIERQTEGAMAPGIFYRPDMYGKGDLQDKSYTNLAASVKSIDFDPWQFRIAPKAAAHMDPNQKVSLISAQQALAGGSLQSVSKERVSVFMGNTMLGPLHHEFQVRFDFERCAAHLRANALFQKSFSASDGAALIEELRERVLIGTIPVTDDTAPGILPSITAARIAAAFDLHGPALVVDAACASGLAAIICGMKQLECRESDAVICGAADMLCREAGFIYFSAIGALSPDGSYPFDERANGFVIGQGAGVVVLKRLADAVKHEDRIYAVVTGYGQASDGKGKAIAAPNSVWQAKTIERAWEMACSPASTIELIEAHGTATQVGDISEAAALKEAFSALGARTKHFCATGSVKSNIGHLKPAAGIAGFIKAALAIDRKFLPPTAGFERENPKLGLADSPFFVIANGREWAAKEHPRRAGVSAFGFGGADFHLALEEFRKEDYEGVSFGRSVTMIPPARDAAPARAEGASSHVVFLCGNSEGELLRQAEGLLEQASRAEYRLAEFCFAHSYMTRPTKPFRMAFTVASLESLRAQIAVFGAAAGDSSDFAP